MAATMTIGGSTVTMIEDMHDSTKQLDEVGRLQCDVIDYTGLLHFQKGDQVVITDPVLGVMFRGFLNTDKEVPQYPSGAILHSIDCTDMRYIADKRTYTANYATSTYASKIVADQLNQVLSQEGIGVNYAVHEDTTASDFNTGNVSNTFGFSNVGDGDLEIAQAGTNMSFSPVLSTGTFTNTTYSSGAITPNTTSTIKLTAILNNPLPNNGTNLVYLTIWTGSVVVHTGDLVNISVFMPSTNSTINGTFNITFSNGNRLNSVNPIQDQNAIPSNISVGSSYVDVSLFEENQWYNRVFPIDVTYNGLTVTSFQIGLGGGTAGTYIGYYKNISFSGVTVFSSTLQANVVQIAQGFDPNLVTAQVVQAYDPPNSSWISGATSIDPVKIVRSSSIVYGLSNNTNAGLYASYDGVAFGLITPNSLLPGLPVGSNVNSTNIYFKLLYNTIDPTIIPALQLITTNLISAPNTTKSDIVSTFENATQWNTGTYSNTAVDGNGNLVLGAITRDWNNNLITNQTLISNNTVTESASSGSYKMTMSDSGTLPTTFGISRLDFAGSVLNCTIDVDLSISHDASEAGVTYRQINWNSGTNNTFGYFVGIEKYSGASVSYVQFGHGSNASNDNYTQIQTYNTTITPGTTYHLKIVVNNTHHQVYFNHGSTPVIDQYDATYVQAGNIGLRGFVDALSLGTTCTSTWDNFSMTPAPSGTWTSSAISISSLGTCGASTITWVQNNVTNNTSSVTGATIQTSIDGGSTYQICTNGGQIPNLPPGTNVSGKSILVKVSLTGQTNILPSISGLVVRVTGAYPTVTGTRDTTPLGNDTMIRANVSNSFGTGFDSQTYTKVGTGTINLTTDEAIISATTGDVHMIYGSRTWTDEDSTIRFSINNANQLAGMELRYVDVNNHYRLSTNSTTIKITKVSLGFVHVLATATVSLTVGSYYRMRFRVTGSSSGNIQLYGEVWPDQTLEPLVTNSTAWTIVGSD